MDALLEAAAGVDFLRFMNGERLGEGGLLTWSCFNPSNSVLRDLLGGVAGARVFMELAGEMLGVTSGEGEAGFCSLGVGLCGGVGVSC